MVQKSFIIIEAEQERADDPLSTLKPFPVSKTSDDAVGASMRLDLLHPLAVPGLIGKIKAFGDHSIRPAARLLEPPPGVRHVPACG